MLLRKKGYISETSVVTQFE